MKFEVPFNNDKNIIDEYIKRKDHISMVYWKVLDNYSHWRKMENKEIISLDELFELIKKLKNNWIPFNYLLNWIIQNNLEYDDIFKEKLFGFINYLHIKETRKIIFRNKEREKKTIFSLFFIKIFVF